MLSFWKLVIVGAIGFLVFRRLPLPRHPIFRLLRPWSSNFVRPAPAPTAAPARPWFHDRWFVFLVITSSSALVAWLLTRMMVMTPNTMVH
ncbi:MAG TPA: hypothetical protein VGZ22_28065 [Isosphaeraceae bacterium]|jgi:hypothetical protein|nr:hypothetical protein [Isosphaeraceae bacterium]